ncbi:MAG: beta-N-acetylhexosaminidase [Myxococcota bacterium]
MSERVTATGEQTSTADRTRRAGQRLLIGFAGPSVDDDLRKLVREIQPAGFVLFARNVEEPAQVRELTRELASLVDARNPALIAVDQEGGRVQRVRAPATVWPPMRDVGMATSMTAEVSRAMARELRALGFNLNFAPVADIDSNPANPVIGDRSFGRDPAEVAKHVVAFLKAHQDEGMIACAKHFPGHGDTHLDSHLALPTVELDIPDLQRRELVPFRAAIAAGVATVMTAHIVFPCWDEEVPATLSPRIIRGVLREQLGYDGVVFSDDLEMKAVHGRWPITESARRMTEASVDILLCCKDPTLQIEAFETLIRLQEDDPALERASIDSVARVHALRERFFLRAPPQPALDSLASPQHLALADEVKRRVHGSA